MCWRSASIVCLLVVGSVCSGNSAPLVKDVTAYQETNGSGIVVITYTLTDADNDKCTITVQVSNDGGNTWMVPATTFLPGSAIGANVAPGQHQILWDSKKDLPGVFGTNYRVKVMADDGCGPAGIVWVYVDDGGMPEHESFKGYMSKCEVTNAQFCEYLNDAKARGLVIVDGNYARGSAGPYSGQGYYRLDGPGYTYNNALNGGASRINYGGASFTVDSGFENHPVTYVTWYGAMAFAELYGWRLPTQWEWQAIADYDGTFTYGCGRTISHSQANYYDTIHPYGTTPVGLFGSYGYGLADMAGNVLEWTASVYNGDRRVIRGGSWNGGELGCRVTYWDIPYPHSIDGCTGFRVCRNTVSIDSGLVAYYKLEDTAGAVIDETGSHNGTNHEATRGVPGKAGYAFEFNGADSYVDCTTASQLNPETLTVSAWIKQTARSEDYASIVGRWGWGTLADSYLMAIWEDGRLYGIIKNSTGGETELFSTEVIALNQWYHVAMTYDGTRLALYINNNDPVNGSLLGTLRTTTEPTTIGVVCRYSLWGYFDGKIDEVRIYNRALNASEIQCLYQNP